MATYTKIQLSGGTTGKSILSAATSTPGTTIHTAHATSTDEIWLWAQNNHTADVVVTIEFGGTTSPNDLIIMTVPTKDGPYLICPGWTLTNSLVVKCFAATISVISINGYVNRIT